MRFGYILKEAVKGLGRNLTMTIALVITTAVSVGLLIAGILVTQMTNDTKELYLEKVEVMVQLNEQISASDKTCTSGPCAELKAELEANPNVELVTFENREQSYAHFVEIFQESDPLLVQETSKDALPAALHVRLKDPSNSSAVESIKDNSAVDTVVDQGEEVRAATGNLDAVRNATFFVAIIQLIASGFLIANMVQLAAAGRARELSIMRMVGASRWFSHAPFVVEAIFAVIIGTIVAGLGVFAAKTLVLDPALANLYASQLIAPIKDQAIWTALPIVGILAVIFATAAALITLRARVRS